MIDKFSIHAIIGAITLLMAQIAGMASIVSLAFVSSSKTTPIIFGSLWAVLIFITMCVCIDWIMKQKKGLLKSNISEEVDR